MIASMLRSAVTALFLFLAGAATAADAFFGTGTVTVTRASGETHRFSVEVAKTADQRARGLMQRTELAPDAGMYFDFGIDREVMMWMKDTPLPLDMLFVDAEGRITRIAERTVPFSEDIVASRGPVRYVLEINGGRAAELGIASGDRLALGDDATP